MERRHRTLILLSGVLVLAPGCQTCVEIEHRTLANGSLESPEPICLPDEAQCDGNLRQVCAPDRASWVDDPCGPLRPTCSGAGVCICVDDSDNDICTIDRCVNGDLVIDFTAPAGRPCDLWQGTPAESSCARDIDGNVRCWGGNTMGELGLGFADDEPHPLPVQLALPPALSLALGVHYACALLRDGTVQCWGQNDFGQARGEIGDTALQPVEIPLSGSVRQIATGAEHACALLENATVACWGRNENGQLGDGSVDNRATPAPVRAGASELLDGVVGIALGARHSCAVLEDGELRCWGAADQVGDGTASPEVPRTFPVPILQGVSRVSCGTDHTCALQHGGEVWCWGLGNHGETGDPAPSGGAIGVTTLPYRVDDDNLIGSFRVSAAYRHSCAAVPGGVWCWGGDFWGQLGNGGDCANSMCTHVPQLKAQQVSQLGTVDEIASGFLHTCVIADGALACWGNNQFGQLGGDNTDGADVPALAIWE